MKTLRSDDVSFSDLEPAISNNHERIKQAYVLLQNIGIVTVIGVKGRRYEDTSARADATLLESQANE